MINDYQTAVAFTNLSAMRRERLSALLASADRAWRVYDTSDETKPGTGTTRWMQAHRSACQATDAQKAAARLLRVGRR